MAKNHSPSEARPIPKIPGSLIKPSMPCKISWGDDNDHLTISFEGQHQVSLSVVSANAQLVMVPLRQLHLLQLTKDIAEKIKDFTLMMQSHQAEAGVGSEDTRAKVQAIMTTAVAKLAAVLNAPFLKLCTS